MRWQEKDELVKRKEELSKEMTRLKTNTDKVALGRANNNKKLIIKICNDEEGLE